jgi:hypothetical protein
MFIKIITLIDHDCNQVYCFSYKGYGMTDDIKEKQLEKLDKIVQKNPDEYIKLMEMLERGKSKWQIREGGKTPESSFEFVYPPRQQNIWTNRLIIESKFKDDFPNLSFKEHIKSVEKKMFEICITYFKDKTKYECINPDTQKIKTENWNKYMKEYYHNNSDSILEYKKQQYQKTKDVLNEKIECGCGKIYTKQHQKRHEKTKKHQDWIHTE